MKADIDIMDINPIVDVGTAKTPMYVLDATWMTVLYEKATGKDFKGDDILCEVL